MGLISESEYYSSLLAINNKYFKNREKYLEDSRSLDVEYYNGMKSIREKNLSDYISSIEELYKVHQNETQYIKDLQWAYANWANMSDDQRKDISNKILAAENSKSENIISDIEHQIKILESRSAYEEELISNTKKFKTNFKIRCK